MTRLGKSGFEAGPARVHEWASGIARAWGSGVISGARAASMRDNTRYQDWAARMERHTCSPGSAGALPDQERRPRHRCRAGRGVRSRASVLAQESAP
jgi:hypothetical protein